MRVVFVISFLLVSFFLFAFLARAQTTVDISNNADNSRSSVSVINRQSAVVGSTTSKSNFQTDIRIETNGKVQTYTSDKPGSVTIQSENGNAKVSVQNDSTGANSQNNPSPSQEEQKIKTRIEQAKDAVQKKITEEKQKTEKIKKQEESIFTFLQNKLSFLNSFLIVLFPFR